MRIVGKSTCVNGIFFSSDDERARHRIFFIEQSIGYCRYILVNNEHNIGVARIAISLALCPLMIYNLRDRIDFTQTTFL